jgi:hypothetical protein
MPVHDVDMDPIGASPVDGAYFVAELAEIGGQDGWSDGKGTVHRYLRSGIDGVGAGIYEKPPLSRSHVNRTPSMA